MPLRVARRWVLADRGAPVVGPVRRSLRDARNRDAGRQLWARTDLKPSDVQMAQLYDGFSWLTMSWLEALGLCGVEGERPVHRGRRADRA